MKPIEVLKSKLNSESHESSLVTFLNPYSYLHFRKELNLFQQFDTLYIDGVFLIFLLRLIGIKVKRLSFDMTSLAPRVFEDCSKNNKSIYIVGSKPDAMEKFIEILRLNYPNLRLIGYRNGYFANEVEREKEINKIKGLSPSVVIVGMGTPLQEKFLLDLRSKGWFGQGYTCGGFIHQSSKSIQYYPVFIDKLNLRWLYRIWDEPQLFSRYLICYPKASLLFILDYLRL